MASSIPGAGEAPQRGLGQRGAGHGSGVGRGTAAGTQSYLRPFRDEMRPAREVGTRRLRLTSALYWAPGTLTHAPRRRSRSAVSTTLSDSSHMKSGIPEVSIPARWWNSVCTNPGHSAMTCTFPRPRPAMSCATPWLKLTTHALDAPYVPRVANAATDDTLMTPPRPRSSIPGSAA